MVRQSILLEPTVDSKSLTRDKLECLLEVLDIELVVVELLVSQEYSIHDVVEHIRSP